jgi:hypothetical protein
MNQPTTILVPILKANNPKVIEALNIIAQVISTENLIKVKDKCLSKGEKINSSLSTGLKFI